MIVFVAIGSFIVGSFAGIVLAAICVASTEAAEEGKEGKDEDKDGQEGEK